MIVTVTVAGFGGGVCVDLRSKILLVHFTSLTASFKEEQPVPGLPSLLLSHSMAKLLPLDQHKHMLWEHHGAPLVQVILCAHKYSLFNLKLAQVSQ